MILTFLTDKDFTINIKVMQKHVSYESAVALHKLGFDEYTEDLYLFARVGIRVERTHTDGNKTERTFHRGDLCQRDPDWAITYPSENWIPAPFVFDAVKWLEETMGIKIVPMFVTDSAGSKSWQYDIVFPKNLEWLEPFNKEKNLRPIKIDKTEYFNTIELAFDDAVCEIMTSSYVSCWNTRLENKYWKTMDQAIQSQFK